MEQIKYTYSMVSKHIGKQKNIALIAHDNKKAKIVEWVEQNKEMLRGHFLYGTGTTARLVTERTSLPITVYKSDPQKARHMTLTLKLYLELLSYTIFRLLRIEQPPIFY